MGPDGAGEDSSAAGSLDGTHLRVPVEPAEGWRPLQLSRPDTRYRCSNETELMRESRIELRHKGRLHLKSNEGLKPRPAF